MSKHKYQQSLWPKEPQPEEQHGLVTGYNIYPPPISTHSATTPQSTVKEKLIQVRDFARSIGMPFTADEIDKLAQKF